MLPTGPIGGVEERVIEIFDSDPQWAVKFNEHAKKNTQAVKNCALQIEHIGSTSVSGLSAKPIIDILFGRKRCQRRGDVLAGASV